MSIPLSAENLIYNIRPELNSNHTPILNISSSLNSRAGHLHTQFSYKIACKVQTGPVDNPADLDPLDYLAGRVYLKFLQK